MKYLITESQYKLLLEEQEVLHFPTIDLFGGWEEMQKYLKRKGNPMYSVGGDLDLLGLPIESLGNLKSVGGSLFLNYTPIESLGNLEYVGGDLDLLGASIKSLGNLKSVEGTLVLRATKINTLGNLKYVGGALNLQMTPISKKYSLDKIRQLVNVNGNIYL